MHTLIIRLARAAGAAAAARLLARALPWQIDSSPRTTRRDFLRWTTAGASTFFLAEAAAGFVAFFWPIKFGRFGTEVIVPPGDIPAVGAAPIANRDGKFWLINNEDGALALYWKCVHLGCTVPWVAAEGQFHCPCHSSIYDRRGVKISGPAPRPLDLMAITVRDGRVIVDSGAISTRADYAPDQATRLPG